VRLPLVAVAVRLTEPGAVLLLALKRRETSVPGVTTNRLAELAVTPAGKALSETCT
jgi:hypothetical protein